MEAMTVLKRSSEHEGGGWMAANHITHVILTIVCLCLLITLCFCLSLLVFVIACHELQGLSVLLPAYKLNLICVV